jgi:AraC-like DNA-binding protein
MDIVRERIWRTAGATLREAVSPRFIDLQELEVPEAFEYPVHQDAMGFELIVAQGGVYRCEVNGVELEVQANHFLLLRPTDWHQDHFSKGDRHLAIHFELDWAEPRTQRLFVSDVAPADQISTYPLGRERTWLDQIKEEANGQQRYAQAVEDALFEAFFWRLIRLLPSRSLAPAFRSQCADLDFLHRLEVLFLKAGVEPLPVAEMAAQLHMSRRSLTDRCQRVLGQSPARALLAWRIRRASRMLATAPLSVKEVSDRLGFRNPYHFSRAYKRCTGESPSVRSLRAVLR